MAQPYYGQITAPKNLALLSTPLADQLTNSLRGPAGRSKASSAFRIEAKCSEGTVLPPSCAHTGGMQPEAEHKDSLYQ